MKDNPKLVGIVFANLGVAIVIYAIIQNLFLTQPDYLYLFWIPLVGVVIEVIGLFLFVKYKPQTKQNRPRNASLSS